MEYHSLANFFSPSQHGFHTRFSCTTQLLEFYHDISQSFGNGKQVYCIFVFKKKIFWHGFTCFPNAVAPQT